MAHNTTRPRLFFRLLPLLLMLLLFGCDLFVSPAKPRDNPLDPNNPTKAVTDFKAYGSSSTSVTVEWTTDADDNGDYPNVMIVRNSEQVPTSINDGTLVYSGPTTIPEGDEYAEYTDNDITSDSDYYYGIWAYTEQEGTVYYNGPVSDTATTTLQEVELSPAWDGHLFWDGPTASFEDSDPMYNRLQYWTATEEYYILLYFDFTSAPDFGDIDESRLIMYKDIDGAAIDWDVKAGKIIQPWSAADDAIDTRNNIVADSFRYFSDDDNAAEISIPMGSSGFFEWDVIHIVSAWLIDEEANYGILVRSRTNDGSGTFNFFNTEYTVETQRPRLNLRYYGDPPSN